MAVAGEVATHVSYLVETSQDKRITGVQLSALIRHKFPDFSPESLGSTNLRDFIRRFVTGVAEVGRSGADIVYGLRRWEEPPKPTGLEAETLASTVAPSSETILPQQDVYVTSAVWKTFASPASEFKLYGNTETGALEIVRPAGSPLQSPWVQIPSCSAEVHVQIAKDFLSQVSDASMRASLESTLGAPGIWWKNYYLEVQRLGLTVQWNQYRRRRIIHELQSALKQRDIPLTGMRAASGVRRSASQSLRERLGMVEVAGRDSLLRSLAIDLVRSMPDSELRELKVPLGYVVDALILKR